MRKKTRQSPLRRVCSKARFLSVVVLSIAASRILTASDAAAQTMLEVNCKSCHTITRNGMSLNSSSKADLGAGTLSVFSVVPGNVVPIGITVTDGHDRYAASLSNLGAGGINNTNDHLSYQPDTNWVNHTTFFATRTANSTQDSLTFNLRVLADTPPDVYLLNMDLAGVTNGGTGEWDQFQPFYLQVVNEPPSPQLLNPSLDSNIFTVTVPTLSGFTYYLEYKQFASDTSWFPAGQTQGNGTAQILSDSTATAPQRFYRVRIQ